MLRKLIVVGAGDAGREVLHIIKKVNIKKKTWEIIGFLNDTMTNIYELTNEEYTIIGTLDGWVPSADEDYVCAISNPLTRRKVVKILESKNAKFITLIDPSVDISDYNKIGKGVIIYTGSVGPNVHIEDYCFIQSTIPHDTTLKQFVTISGGVTLGGHLTIGEESFIASGAIIIPNVRIGKNSYVGAGSVVIRNVKANTKVFGNPAKVIN